MDRSLVTSSLHAAPGKALRALFADLGQCGSAIAVLRAGTVSANLVGSVELSPDGLDEWALRIAGCHCHLHVPWHEIADIACGLIDVGYGGEPTIALADADGTAIVTLYFNLAAAPQVLAAYLRYSAARELAACANSPAKIALIPVTERRPASPATADAFVAMLASVGIEAGFAGKGDWRDEDIAPLATRVSLFQSAWLDPTISHIWAGLGGYGSGLLIDALAETDLGPPAGRKTLIGASDVSQLGAWLGARYDSVGYVHAFNFEDEALLGFRRDDLRALLTILVGAPPAARGYQIDCFAGLAGPISGRALPLNATAARSLAVRGLPTDYEPTVLFLEDIGETLDRVARIFDDLANLGVFTRARAVVLGEFLGDVSTGYTPLDGSELVKLVQSRADLPVVHLPVFGHGRERLPIVLGAPVTISRVDGRVCLELGFAAGLAS